MAVHIASVAPGSVSADHGVRAGDTLISLNGHEIHDVLDYRFYGTARRLHVVIHAKNGGIIDYNARSGGDADTLGLGFETYLMDRQRACKNHCIFCFIDQMPRGMRRTLYFKDDDYRLSFFFGNYVTMTNMTPEDVRRILELHLSPINISVHTMDPDLRVKMLRNPDAGRVLSYIGDLARGGVTLNIQFVLCPGINDGEKLLASLNELYEYKDAIASAAVVPVGLTGHREGLFSVRPYTREEAAAVIDLTDSFNTAHREELGRNFVYAADEFFIKAQRPFPAPAYYDDYPQLENGVGMWAMTRQHAFAAVDAADECAPGRSALITGVAAAPLIRALAKKINDKFPETHVDVFTIVNDFFGHDITVAGLLTGGDIAAQAGDLSAYDRVILPDVMLRSASEPVFLDDMTLETLSGRLKTTVIPVPCEGRELFDAINGAYTPENAVFRRNVYPAAQTP